MLQVGRASGPGSAAMHAVFGAFLLFNVLFNHAQVSVRIAGRPGHAAYQTTYLLAYFPIPSSSRAHDALAAFQGHWSHCL